MKIDLSGDPSPIALIPIGIAVVFTTVFSARVLAEHKGRRPGRWGAFSLILMPLPVFLLLCALPTVEHGFPRRKLHVVEKLAIGASAIMSLLFATALFVQP